MGTDHITATQGLRKNNFTFGYLAPVAQALVPNATYFLILVTILHESWGSQSWLQPAFSRRLRLRRLAHGAQKPPRKAAAGKIARPTTNAGCPDREKYVALGTPAARVRTSRAEVEESLPVSTGRLSG